MAKIGALYRGSKPMDEDKALALIKRSKHLHSKWYVERYPDVRLTGLSPEVHYLRYGAMLDRNPGKNFDTAFYRKTYLGAAGLEINPLVHYESNIQQRNLPTHGRRKLTDIRRLARMLWAGMAEAAVTQLEEVISDTSQPPKVRALAMIELARWYNHLGEEFRSLKLLEDASRKFREFREFRGSYLKLGFMYAARGDTDAARHAFLLMPKTEYEGRALATSNTFESDLLRLNYINEVFNKAGFARLERRDRNRPLGLDNLTTTEPLYCGFDIGLVSIIMPAFMCETTIATAIRSLQSQTYRNLEIIVVDDCSPDKTSAIVKRLAEADDRIRMVRMQENSGAYPARNRGLAEARGVFLTTHDADDWSHPQKIECQLKAMLENMNLVAVSTYWVRCRADLRFTYNWRLGDWLPHLSHSSFLFRRQVYEELGGWDAVRVSADTEFIWRVENYFGREATTVVAPNVPLAFSLDDEYSLTRTKVTHVSTTYYGLRQYYRAISRYWLDRAPRGLTAEEKILKRKMLPPEILSRDAPRPELDLLIRTDFRVAERVERAAGLIRKDQLVGLLHWPDPEIDGPLGGDGREFAFQVFDLLVRDNVRAVLPSGIHEGRFGQILDL